MSAWWSYCQVRYCETLGRVDTVQEGNRKCTGFFTVKVLWTPSTINHVGLASMVGPRNCLTVTRKPWKIYEPTYPSHESFSNATDCTWKLKLAFAPPQMVPQRSKADTGNALAEEPASPSSKKVKDENPSHPSPAAKSEGTREGARAGAARRGGRLCPAGPPAPPSERLAAALRRSSARAPPRSHPWTSPGRWTPGPPARCAAPRCSRSSSPAAAAAANGHGPPAPRSAPRLTPLSRRPAHARSPPASAKHA